MVAWRCNGAWLSKSTPLQLLKLYAASLAPVTQPYTPIHQSTYLPHTHRPPPACRRLLDQSSGDDADAVANTGCLLFKEGDYAAAAKKFEDAMHALGRLVSVVDVDCCARVCGIALPCWRSWLIAADGDFCNCGASIHLPALHLPFSHQQPELLYNSALCAFRLGAHAAALKLVAEIVDVGVRNHPELGVGR